MTRAASVRSSRGRASASRENAGAMLGYFQRAELPLTSLAFLLPFIVVYEIGTRYMLSSAAGAGEQRIIAFTLLQRFFNAFGATGRYLPALAVVGILLAWHIARKDRWRLYPGTLLGMILESFVLSAPLLALGFAFSRFVGMYAAPELAANLLILSIGAGIYEELVFRLIAFTVLNLVLLDVFQMHRGRAYLLIVLISSVAFSGYHYLGSEPFEWPTFAFRTAAGLYFGAIFLFRGFGITAGSHAAYDVLIVLLRLLPPQ